MSEVLQQLERPEVIRGFRGFVKNFAEYVEFARDLADDHAESYRGFDVGTLGVGIRPGYDELFTIEGANFKIKHAADSSEDDPEIQYLGEDMHEKYGIPYNPPKVCAEMAAHIEPEEDLYIVGQVIAASTNTQEIFDITGTATCTLPPCDECTVVLDKTPVTSNATLYCSVGLIEDIFQIRNLRLLKQLHSRKQERDLPLGRVSADIGQKAVELFDQRISRHDFSRGNPSRPVSNFARIALLRAGGASPNN